MHFPATLITQLLLKLITEAGGVLADPGSPVAFTREADVPGLAEILVVGTRVDWPRQPTRPETFVFARPKLDCAAAATIAASENVTPVRVGDEEILVWRYPFDPVLTALPEVAFSPQHQLQVYRPLSGATFLPLHGATASGNLQATAASAETVPAVVKVLPETRAADLARTHDLFRSHDLPVASVLSHRGQLLELTYLDGVTVEEPFSSADLVQLLKTFPAANTATWLEPKPSVFARRHAYFAYLLKSHPELAKEVATIAEWLEALTVPSISAKDAPTNHLDTHTPSVQKTDLRLIHGDFHTENLLLNSTDAVTRKAKQMHVNLGNSDCAESSYSLRLLDLEAVRPGFMAEDLGCFLAHAAIAKPISGNANLAALCSDFSHHCPPEHLLAFATSHLLALIPHVNREPAEVLSRAVAIRRILAL